MSRLSLLALVACLVALLSTPGMLVAAADPPAGALSAETRRALTDSLARATAFLRQQQKSDGTWESHPGITALTATAILRQPGNPRAQALELTRPALDALVKLQKPDGGIYERDLPHYITAVSVMALVAGGRPEDRRAIERARAFLVENLVDEGEGYTPADKFYGGLGYGSDLRPDLANLEYGLRALKESALPKDHPAWEKAIKFLQRTQNYSETNDQAWAGNDGGFVYYPGFSYHQAGGTRSYGSMTYAGLLSYSYATVKKDDARVQAALRWIRDNYTIDENPGMAQKTVYYYYMVFAKALQAYGEPTIADARGQLHNWREELGKKLLSLQYPEGYWVNAKDKDYWQDNKVLVTAFTMMAVEAVLEK
jgi:squalene-hopene/tetraprenyl-beta-curcumene cyclase